MKLNRYTLAFLILSPAFNMFGQQELLDQLDAIAPDSTFAVQATFKSTRIGIGHSVETRRKGVLEVTAQNRFWNRPTEETTQTFAADKYNGRFELAYGVTDQLTVGGAFGTGYTSIDLFAKYRLLYQKPKLPISLSVFQNVVHREKNPGIYSRELNFSDELAYTSQVLIASKINSNLSLQLSPTFIYRNADRLADGVDPSSFALGLGARYKIGRFVSLTSEYFLVDDPSEDITTYGPFSLGVNWEIADLMLQFKLTNARNLVEDKFIARTFNNFNFRNGNLHFGFQATYLIHFKHSNRLKK